MDIAFDPKMSIDEAQKKFNVLCAERRRIEASAKVSEAQKRLSALQARAALLDKVQAIAPSESEVHNIKRALANGTAGPYKAKFEAILAAAEEAKAAASKPAAVAPKAALVATAAPKPAPAVAPKKTKFQQYRELQASNPEAAGKFWAANEKDIIAGK